MTSGAAISAKRAGIVDQVDAARIVIRATGEVDAGKSGVDIYTLMKFQRSNQSTCINQRPLVKVGDVVNAGDVIADGPSTEFGELALGRNALVAFMPWNGYNYEDSILISERIVKDDVFTSIHIDEFEVMARDTKLGPEDITRDIPNVGEEALRNLDEAGIVYIGAEVEPGDILVGKITPKGESPMTPEEKLLRAIFGEKASRRARHVAAPAAGRCRHDRRRPRLQSPRHRQGRARDGDRARGDRAPEEGLGRRAHDPQPRDLVASARDAARSGRHRGAEGPEEGRRRSTWTCSTASTATNGGSSRLPTTRSRATSKPSRGSMTRPPSGSRDKFHDRREKLERGDELPPGVLKMVKVFVAVKRKLQPGDKMAGRHGNKGVISRILPQEDMPFLADGTPVDLVLNPLGVPSRMNVGQIFETHLGWAARDLGMQVAAALEEWREANPDAKAGEMPDAVHERLLEVYGDHYAEDIEAASRERDRRAGAEHQHRRPDGHAGVRRRA